METGPALWELICLAATILIPVCQLERNVPTSATNTPQGNVLMETGPAPWELICLAATIPIPVCQLERLVLWCVLVAVSVMKEPISAGSEWMGKAAPSPTVFLIPGGPALSLKPRFQINLYALLLNIRLV